MKNPYYKNKELQDEQIVEALKRCPEQYEDGEIVEVRDTLYRIVCAIDLFTRDYDKNERQGATQQR